MNNRYVWIVEMYSISDGWFPSGDWTTTRKHAQFNLMLNIKQRYPGDKFRIVKYVAEGEKK
jgi:hypothetical protein